MKGHIRQRGEDSWSLVIDLGKDENGKRRQKWHTVHGGKRKAQKELTRLLSDLDAGKYVEKTGLTVGNYLVDWLAIIQPKLSGKTFYRYEEITRLHLIPALGKYDLQKLNAMQIEAHYAQLRLSGRVDGKGGLSEQTLLHIHRVLSEALKRAVRLKLCPYNPCEDVQPPRPVKREVNALSEAQSLELLQAAQGTRLHTPILLALTTGLRLGELLALQWKDVNFDASELAVNRTVQRIGAKGLVVKDSPKTRTSRRVVTLPPVTVEALKAHLLEQKKERLRLGGFWEDQGLAFPNEQGGLWGPDALSHSFGNLAKKAGFDLTFHGLRHTHATHLLRAGVSAKVASTRLGHAGIAITLDLYSHVLRDAQDEVASRIDKVFQGVSNSKI